MKRGGNVKNDEDGLKRTETIKIEGMTCRSCAQTIEEEVRSIEGVAKVEVKLDEDYARVTYDASKTSRKQIKEAIESCGYSCGNGKKRGRDKSAQGTLLEGAIYGLLPHTGCIAFIAASILGATFLMDLFKPLLMSRYFFYGLIVVSFVFATASAAIYLKNNGLLSTKGIVKKWKYLLTMYSSTIGVNVLFFFFIFPMLANVSSAQIPPASGQQQMANGQLDSSIGAAEQGSALSTLTLKVDIPCSGHAPLISNEVKSVVGVKSVEFKTPNTFEIKYEGEGIRERILGLEVFKEYPATVLSGTVNANAAGVQPLGQDVQPFEKSAGGCGCGGN